jgi:hypothetical protein
MKAGGAHHSAGLAPTNRLGYAGELTGSPIYLNEKNSRHSDFCTVIPLQFIFTQRPGANIISWCYWPESQPATPWFSARLA